MSWILVGSAVAGATLGKIKHHQEEAKYNEDKQRQADIERYSYASGTHGQMPTSPGSEFGAMLQGGVSGAMMGQQFGGKAAPGADPMAGAQKVGSVGGGDSAFAQSASSPGSDMMAGGYSQAPDTWNKMNQLPKEGMWETPANFYNGQRNYNPVG